MKKLGFAVITWSMILATSCSSGNGLIVNVENQSDLARERETVELSSDSILSLLGSSYCYVTDADGNEVPSQITYDGLLIFQPTVGAYQSVQYKILPSDTLHLYPQLTSGRKYPERADDVAWENENVGFRAYGPATQAKGEKAYGYDIFFKHHTDEQILESLYEPETNPATWVKVDSLRAISDSLAEDYIKSFSYHIDHGLGMDCYAVGPTLGAGVAAPLVGDTISFPWCYETAEVLDNGPLRFTVEMSFAPRRIGGDSSVVEHRIISLDAGSYLNRTKVWYDGQTAPIAVATGFPLRDDFSPVADKNIIAYSDPTQGNDNGRAFLGAVPAVPFASTAVKDGHILGISEVKPENVFEYYWGFNWSKERLNGRDVNISTWTDYLKNLSCAKNQPLRVTVKK